MKKYIKLLRIRHYIKNILIFLPVFFSKMLFELSILSKMFCCFISFCALSSAVYIFNDICDVQHDKKHPIKCLRPIASGNISRKKAIALIVILLFVCIVTNILAGGTSILAWGLLAVYLFLNILYSLKLKEIPVLDIAILISGFFIRVFYGSVISDRNVSKWLYLVVVAVSFYLALGKRRNEIVLPEKNETRPVLKYYSYNFLDKNMYICSALTIVFYSLWSVDPLTIEFFGTRAMIWTVPLVILICMTYSFSVEKSKADDPVDVLLSNKLLLILVLLYGTSVLGIIYLS